LKKICFLFILLIVTACATSPTGRRQLMLVSPEQAISSSREAYTQTLLPLEKAGKLDTNHQITDRVRRITGKVIAQTIILYPKTSNWQWNVRVIDDAETINAWCMAGGKMAIYSGLLIKINPTDDELAQVMGHEISHAVANHTAEKMSMALASQIGLATVAIATNGEDGGGAALTGAALAAALAIQLPNSRTAETEADRIGIELAARAGYDPRAAISLWQKMGKAGGNRPPEFISTHPDPANRMSTLRRLIPRMMPYYEEVKERPVYIFRTQQ
jgi:predicted Zn-dependent protease